MSKPLLTIGLPVRNGQRFLAEVLNSVLGQDFDDFTLVISDNASTDGTSKICSAAAERDPRIVYLRQEKILSISENFNRVADNVQTQYFKWIADDDLMEPTFLSACVGALQRDEGAVLAYPRSIEIDADGKVIGPSWTPKHDSGSESPCRRFRYLCFTRPCYEIFGVIRTDVLAKVKPQGSFVSADRVFLAELSLQGRFHEVEEPLFLHREHPGRAGGGDQLQQVQQHMTPDDPDRIVFPHARLFQELLGTISRARLPFLTKACCTIQALRWGARATPNMIGDIAYAMRRLGARGKSDMRSLGI